MLFLRNLILAYVTFINKCNSMFFKFTFTPDPFFQRKFERKYLFEFKYLATYFY